MMKYENEVDIVIWVSASISVRSSDLKKQISSELPNC